MAIFPGQLHLSLFTLLSLIFLVHGRLNLETSDLSALSIIRNDLGFTGQRQSTTVAATHCNISGVFCQRRRSNNTYVLRITRLVFASQGLAGVLSPAIGMLSELKELTLSNNNIVDQLPVQIIQCRKLEILNIRNNQFSGEVPSELSSLVRLRVLDLSSNKFSGDLSFLKYFPNLEQLSLSDNMFIGKIPKSIRSFRNLQFFNVSGNRLAEDTLPMMNLPKRYIFAENSTGRNNSIAMAPSTSNDPNAEAPSPAAAPHHNSHNKKKIAGRIIGFLAGALAGTISGFVLSVIFKLMMAAIRGGVKDSGPVLFSSFVKKKEDLAFLEKDDGLASLVMIGRGGCGEVYRTELYPGKMIAIKKIIQPLKDADIDAGDLNDEDSKLLNKKLRQIRSEIQTVGQIRHRNLLPLVAHVPRPDCHYLVYEYMKNGSLQDALNRVSEGTMELDWAARLKIAVGIADGLEYLHMSHNPHIFHRDLKPANVLLDDDMEARIADFGLAKTMPDAKTHLTLSTVAGTVGYIAPEYHQTLKFTEKCDMYSFGVLLGVLVMGKQPSDDFFQNTAEISLVKWMRNVMTSENPQEAIDPKMVGKGFDEQILLVLKIACFCTLDNPKERPNSKDVRCMLSQIKQ